MHDELFSFRLTSETIAQLEQLAFNVTKERAELIDTVFKSVQKLESIHIPNELSNPLPYDPADYPLCPNDRTFLPEHPYDYLTTFSVRSFKEYLAKKVNEKSDALINNILEVNQCQSRLTNIWRQLASVLIQHDLRFGEGNVYRRIIYTILHGCNCLPLSGDLPFYENHNRFVFVNLDLASVLPLLIYALTALGFHRLCSLITDNEMAMIANNYMHMARKSYQDTKLSLKSLSRDWLIEGISALEKVYVPIWDEDLALHGMRLKRTKEPDFITATFRERRAERKKKLHPDIYDYIEKSIQVKNQPELLRRYAVCRLFEDDGTYYKTATELSLRKAVAPQIRETVVRAPIELESTSFGTIKQTFAPDTPEDAVVRAMSCYLDVTIKKAEEIDLDEMNIEMLKMTSAGIQLTKEAPSAVPVSKAEKKIGTKRLVVAAKESKFFRNLGHFLERLGSMTNAVERQQIDRRQRMIAGINNEKLFGSMGSYLVLKSLFESMSAAAQGKQTGNALDIFDMLKWTSMQNVLCSSIDVKGMDTSVQTLTRDLVHTFLLHVARQTTHGVAGPFNRDQFMVIDKSTGEYKLTPEACSALLQLIVYEKANSQTSVTYESSAFGRIKNEEGTFSSGRADTGGHHTAVLPSTLLSSEMRNSRTSPSVRASKQALGDDLKIVYAGRMDLMKLNADQDSQSLREIGFTVAEESSINSMVFLQQHCVNGTFVGYPDRIAIFTKERNNENVSKLAVLQEIRALCDDLAWRTVNMQGLRFAMIMTLYLCMSRVTIKIDTRIADELLKYIQTMTQAYMYVTDEDTRKTRLLSFHLPFMWMFIEKGGELPCFSVERSDGTFTPEESIHTPRGKFRRRLIYDILNVGDSFNIDHRWLTKLGITRALRLIALDVIGSEFEVKRDDFDKRKLSEYGRQLESLTSTDKYEASRKAADQLAREGFRLPNTIVFGNRLTERILQAVEAVPLSDSQRRLFSNALLERAKIAKSVFFMPERNDELYKIRLSSSEFPIDVTNVVFLAHDTQISLNTHLSSESTSALQMLGYVNVASSAMRSAINASRGVYANFKYDDPMFKEAYRIWIGNRSMMQVFYTAIAAAPKMQVALQRALTYYHQNINHQYLLSLSPRNLFFIAEQPNNIHKNFTVLPSISRTPLLYAILYAELLRLSYVNDGMKYNIHMHGDLLKKLM
nr:hypothetical protein [Clanis bilineata cypovirus]